MGNVLKEETTNFVETLPVKLGPNSGGGKSVEEADFWQNGEISRIGRYVRSKTKCVSYGETFLHLK